LERQITLRDKWGNLAVTISIKGIVFEDGKIWLRKNERGDWELPGGRLDEGEQPEETVAREILEELGRKIDNLKLVDVCIWQKDFGSTTHVEIVTYCCEAGDIVGSFEHVGEAGKSEFKQFSVEEALRLNNLPNVYKRAIQKL
jgi:8-oxo-dGTP pyrophosphatase MutT (NUDIX family)